MPPKRLDDCMMDNCDERVKWVVIKYSKRNIWSFSCDRHLHNVARIVSESSPSIVVRRYE